MISRKPADSDYPRIYYLLERAFAPSMSEATLIKELKSRGKIWLDFIIEKDGTVLAYICYSAAYDNQRTHIGFHLAPLAVLPGRQRQGLGQRIMTESLKLLPKDRPIYVLGCAEYYKRFGFRPDKTQKCCFDPEGRHFMVLYEGQLPLRDVLYEDEFYQR